MSSINPEMWACPQLNNQSRTIKERLSPSNIKSYIIKTYCQITKPQIVKVNGIKIFVSNNIQGDILRTVYVGTYEKYELGIVKSCLSSNDVVLELGAGIGLISSYCAKQIGSDRVFAYEANPKLESDIRRNYQLNDVSPNLEMCILGEKSGEETFYIHNDFWSSSIVSANSDNQKIDEINVKVNVKVRSFNKVISIIKPTFLIIDIEGGEYDLFKYADLSNIKKICLELHNDILGKEKTKFVLFKLAEWGFLIDEKVSKKRELFLQRF